MRIWLIAAACLALGACTTTNTRMAAETDIGKPTPNSKVLVVTPEVQLSLLTAAGLQEAKADWSKQGREDLSAELKTALEGKAHVFERFDPGAAQEGRAGQILRLNDAVGQSIMAFNYGHIKLPTKTGTFDWTLGEGVQDLAPDRHGDYALFVTARGSYASAGRKAMMVGAALFGVAVPLGSQTVFASLVDLKTGRVVWFNVALAGPNADMRTEEGAKSLVASLLQGAPL